VSRRRQSLLLSICSENSFLEFGANTLIAAGGLVHPVTDLVH
jgi:hypothetical protein